MENWWKTIQGLKIFLQREHATHFDAFEKQKPQHIWGLANCFKKTKAQLVSSKYIARIQKTIENIQNIQTAKNPMNSKATWKQQPHMSKHGNMIATPLLGKVRHEIDRANLGGGWRKMTEAKMVVNSYSHLPSIPWFGWDHDGC